MSVAKLIVVIGLFVFGILSVLLGAEAYGPYGLRVSRKVNITGRVAKLIGLGCIAFGVLVVFCGLWIIIMAGLYTYLIPPFLSDAG